MTALLTVDGKPALDAVADFSHWQASVNFTQLRTEGLVAAVLKATEGPTATDDAYARRVGLCRTAGLLVGSYHFGTSADGVAQADHFLAVAKAAGACGPGDVLVLDLERRPHNWPSMTREQAEAFAGRVLAVTGKLPVLYGGADYLGNLGVPAGSYLARCEIWWAAYHEPAKGGPRVPAPWRAWRLWQYTDHGLAAGLKVDRDIWNGDEAALRAWWGR